MKVAITSVLKTSVDVVESASLDAEEFCMIKHSRGHDQWVPAVRIAVCYVGHVANE